MVVLMDTSTAIDLCEKQYKSKINQFGNIGTTYGIMKEMEDNFYSGRLNPEIMKRVCPIDPIALGATNRMKIKEDVIYAHLKSNSQKKLENDPISQADIGLITETIAQAKAGSDVTLFSEDGHVLDTIRYMLNDGYGHLKSRIKVKSVRET